MRNSFMVVALTVLAILVATSCKNAGNGELIGVESKKSYSMGEPYGMTYIPMGSFTMGVGDEDYAGSNFYRPKTITVSAFYMDETEITNSEYRQFVNWVRDSIARTLLGEAEPEKYLIEETEDGVTLETPVLNWNQKIDWSSPEVQEALESMYVPAHEVYYNAKEIDARKLYYEYKWIDMNAAARKQYEADADPMDASFATRPQGRKDRSVFIHSGKINVYPDTLCWISDFAYSYNEPLAKYYFSHPSYNHYPVVGVNWSQARAFCVWRTNLKNQYLSTQGQMNLNEYRLPTEAEWEWAARGGYERNPYPWGGPYTFNDKGCYLANFKPDRGNYALDGGSTTVIVAHYPPNDYGLYDMSGNVAEWTVDAFDESSYNYEWDMNSSYTYNAKNDDNPAMKRKVVRGGSWKDVYANIQTATRDYQYQDTATCYLGFRCVQSYLGSQRGESRNASAVY